MAGPAFSYAMLYNLMGAPSWNGSSRPWLQLIWPPDPLLAALEWTIAWLHSFGRLRRRWDQLAEIQAPSSS